MHLSRPALPRHGGTDPRRRNWTVFPVAALASTLLLAGLLAVPSSAGAATPLTATTPGLGAAAAYSVLGATVTNAGTTVVGGDLGVSPGATLVGFPPGVVDGVEHVGDSEAATAQEAMATASAAAAAETPTGPNLAGDLGGVTLDAGVYAAGAAISIAASTTMTLDGQGNPNSVFIFQFGAAFAPGASSTIKLVNDAQASNVFWVVTGAVSIGATASFSGTILTPAAITLGAGASLEGRALSSAAVTLSSNAITVPPGPPTATIALPVTGNTYLVGQSVATSFSCADPTGPGVATCIDAAGSISPGVLNTSTIGTYVYTVTATSTDGQTGTASSSYTVVSPDAVAFVSPPTTAQTTTASDTVLARGTQGDAGAVTYSSTTPSICTVGSSSGALSFLTFGTCTIQASQAADPADSFASGSAVTSIAVSVPDALLFSSPPTPTTAVTSTMIDVVLATGTSGDAGAITYTSQTPAICGVKSTSGALNFVSVGTCSVQATQAADLADGYLSMTVVTNITVDAESTVAFDSPPTTALTATTTDAVLASGAPGDLGAISYSSITPAVCAVNALTGVLSFTTAGDCIVEATQAADAADGFAAGTVETSITVTSPSTLGFVSPPASALTSTTTDAVLAVGAPDDTGAVTYASNTPLVCAVGSTSGILSFTTSGSCIIEATEAADTVDGYALTTAVTAISVTTPDPLTFVSPPTSALTTTASDTVLAVGAPGDEGAISYTSNTPSVCSVGVTSGTLLFFTAGSCVLGATQAADAADGYAVTFAGTRITVVATAFDALAFVSPPTNAVTATTTDAVLAAGSPDDLGAISYSSVTPLVCSVNALTGVLSFAAFGDCIIEASQAADAGDGYGAGTVETSISVTVPDIFAFVSPPTHALTTTTNDTLLAFGSSGDTGAVTYASKTPSICTVGPTSGSLRFVMFGGCVIEAAQAADAADGYAPATAATSIVVSLPDPVMFVSPPASALTTTTTDTVVAVGSPFDSGAVSYTSEAPRVCAVGSTSGTLRFATSGSCTIEATQAADAADGYGETRATTTISVTDAVYDTLTFVSPPISALTTTKTDAVLAAGALADRGSITYSSRTPSVCAVGSSTGVLSFTTFGNCIIEATQAADIAHSYPSETVAIRIIVFLPDSFAFVSPPTRALTTTTNDRVFAVGALKDKGAVSYASNRPSVCRVGRTSGAVKYLVPGTCVIVGTQAAEPSHGYKSETAVILIRVSFPPSRTVIFKGNGSTRGAMRPETRHSPAKLTANGFRRIGYVFAGWNTARDGKGRRYAGGASYGFGANVTLYAQWNRSRV